MEDSLFYFVDEFRKYNLLIGCSAQNKNNILQLGPRLIEIWWRIMHMECKFSKVKVNELKVLLDEKKAHITTLMEKTFEVRGMKKKIQNNILLAKKQRDKYESEHSRGCSLVAKLRNREDDRWYKDDGWSLLP
ncbi:hypothetical protein HPP92_022008 [Vanilla planifolia]|uniref:Uncharacterized protein n=1 Tax=Vanilla planifolia TaxID=51239 RepID=A0A835PUJ3_VANPL|nr:hypothetical protein HPP92_022008 [Vanilla planifolia]